MSTSDLAKKFKEIVEDIEHAPLLPKVQGVDLGAIFMRMINAHTKAKNEIRKPSVTIKPSSIADCPTKLITNLLGMWDGEQAPLPAPKLHHMNSGSALHEWVQESILKDMHTTTKGRFKVLTFDDIFAGKEGVENMPISGIEVKYRDYRYSKVLPISAAIDGVFSIDDIPFLFEFKTTKEEIFNSLYAPTVLHLRQGGMYALSTGIRKVLFVYFNRNNSKFKHFLFEYTDKHMFEMHERVKLLDESYAKQHIPEPSPHQYSCYECGYKTKCDFYKKGGKIE
jgi:hypothetical protein